MNLKFFWLITTMCLVAIHQAEAQQAKKTYRIGYLTNSSEFRKQSEGTFRQALRDRGYIEEQNLVIDWRFSKGKLDQLPQLEG